MRDRRNDPGVIAFCELLLAKREMLKEELSRREDPETRGACKELDSLLKKILE